MSSSKLPSSDRPERQVKALAGRILAPMKTFKDDSVRNRAMDEAHPRTLGIYSSVGGDSVRVTTEGINVEGQDPAFIEFRTIKKVLAPPKGPTAGTIEIHLSDGSQRWLEIRGGDERFRDAYEFTRFLMRAAKAWREHFKPKPV